MIALDEEIQEIRGCDWEEKPAKKPIFPILHAEKRLKERYGLPHYKYFVRAIQSGEAVFLKHLKGDCDLYGFKYGEKTVYAVYTDGRIITFYPETQAYNFLYNHAKGTKRQKNLFSKIGLDYDYYFENLHILGRKIEDEKFAIFEIELEDKTIKVGLNKEYKYMFLVNSVTK